MVVSSVTVASLSCCRAAKTAAAQLRMVPPTQNPRACVRSAPVMSRTTSTAFEWPHLEVIIPRQMTGFRYRAAPRDQKYLMALRDRVLDQRISRAKVEQIIFVDAWRHDQQGRLLDLTCLRGILDQLNQFIFENHRARGGREIAPDFKGRLIDPCDPPLLEVINQILHAVREARRAGFDRLADHFGIGRGKIRRTHRINKLAGIKPKLQFCLVVDLRPIDELMQLP